MTDDMKRWIDRASYEQLLSRWRTAPIGSPWFIGEMGDYYTEAMEKAKQEIPHDEQVAASKRIGWD